MHFPCQISGPLREKSRGYLVQYIYLDAILGSFDDWSSRRLAMRQGRFAAVSKWRCMIMGRATADRATPCDRIWALAGASGSSRQTATLVTPSARPVVSVAVLLELARWCQQRLTRTEDGDQCSDAQRDSILPPFCAPGRAAEEEAGDSPLAAVGPRPPTGSGPPSDTDDRHHLPDSRTGDERGVPDESR